MGMAIHALCMAVRVLRFVRNGKGWSITEVVGDGWGVTEVVWDGWGFTEVVGEG